MDEDDEEDDLPCGAIPDVHIFQVADPPSDTPPERRCACGAFTFAEMDEKLLEHLWRLT